jgi:VCBS repeat-containing protein
LFANNGFGFDNDPDGGTFAVTDVSVGAVGEPITLPSGALLIVNADGTFNYDPNHKFDYLPTPDSGASNLTVTDTFSYAITGGDTATVTVTVSGVDTNDVLYDSAVDDTLAGGIGDDLYYVHNTGDVVIEATNGGHDTVGAYVDYTLPDNSNIELLSMLGSGLTGTGSSGADTLQSNTGPNTLIGLGGDDLYYVNNADDIVIEASGGGVDTVLASVDYTMPANVEGLYMVGSGLTGGFASTC